MASANLSPRTVKETFVFKRKEQNGLMSSSNVLYPSKSSPAKCPFRRIMAANRGEIAVRIMRAASELGIETVGIYGYEDRNSSHRWNADKSFLLPSNSTPVGAYLNIPAIIKIAKENQCDAIHPGYGLLSENADFAGACEEAGITFIGPKVENLEMFGDKTTAKKLAIEAGASVVPGTDGPVEKPEEALAFVEKYGLPVIVKASKGGGGKGMRVVRKHEDLLPFFNLCSSEALASFGDGSCFIERFVSDAKHVEVQVIGDGKGNVVHLWERDCSIQRRHQKLIEIAPACHLDPEIRRAVREDAVKIASHVNYRNAGTVEFIVDETGRHYFMEVNPRIQVEHTVTEEVTNIDIVQTGILLAGGNSLEVLGLSNGIVPRGVALQCRITTEDPEKDFAPDTGLITVLRHSTGPGIRIDGVGYSGMTVTPHYDSLLVKYTARASTWDGAVRRMRRALSELQIHGVKTNIPFFLNVLNHPDFARGDYNLHFIERNPDLLKVTSHPVEIPHAVAQGQTHQNLDDVEGYLKYIANLAVNGHPTSLGANPMLLDAINNCDIPPPDMEAISAIVARKGSQVVPWRKLLRNEGAVVLAKALRDHPRLLFTDTTWRDAHQSLLATRMRTVDLLKSAKATNFAYSHSDVFSVEMWGGATFDVSMNFLKECPWKRLEALREAAPDIPFQMLLRGANAVGYCAYPDNVLYAFCKQAYESGIDIFRVFDSLNDAENMKPGIKAVNEAGGFVEAAICYTGDVTNTDENYKYNLQYYIDYATQLVEFGTHALAIKDMAGLLTPRAAKVLVSGLREAFPDMPIHVHSHDTGGSGVASMLAAAEAGADIVDGAIDTLSGCTSQPSLGTMVAGVGPGNTSVDLEVLSILNQYWQDVRGQYAPFEVPLTTSSDVYVHEIPGGQYTNLLFQSRQLGLAGKFAEIKHAYVAANRLMGDIPKVTPSSKAVGDLAQFMVGMGIKEEELIRDAESLPLPNSVVEYFQGALGTPPGGDFGSEELRNNVLKGRSLADGRLCFEGRPGAELPDYDFSAAQEMLQEAYGSDRIGFKDVLSHALYPVVFKEWLAHERIYGEVEHLPTNLFLRPMKSGEEVVLTIEAGRDYYLKLDDIDEYDESTGSRTVTFEVNGERWFIRTPDVVTPLKMNAAKGGSGSTANREKADPTNKGSVGCPMPGVVVEVYVEEGDEVDEGKTLLKMSAMKMETEIKSGIKGTVKRVLISEGDSLEGDDLLVELE